MKIKIELLAYYLVKERSALNKDNYEIWRKKLVNSVTCKGSWPLSGTPPFYPKNGWLVHFDDDDDNDDDDNELFLWYGGPTKGG